MTYTSPVQNFLLKIRTKAPPTLLDQLSSLFPPQIFSFLCFLNLPNGTTIYPGTQNRNIESSLVPSPPFLTHSDFVFLLPSPHQTLSICFFISCDRYLIGLPSLDSVLLPSTIQEQDGMNEIFISAFLSWPYYWTTEQLEDPVSSFRPLLNAFI